MRQKRADIHVGNAAWTRSSKTGERRCSALAHVRKKLIDFFDV
jgi:hypothetical protein